MHKLKIVDPTALDMGDMLGIPIERRREISKELDRYFKIASSGPLKFVHASEQIQAIESLCTTDEEFFWAYNIHIQWLHRDRRVPLVIKGNIR